MTKTIAISDKVYELLSKFKLPGESFSDVIKKIISSFNIKIPYDRDIKKIQIPIKPKIIIFSILVGLKFLILIRLFSRM